MVPGLRVRVARLVGVAGAEVVGAAVEVVGAGTGLRRHHGGNGLAQLGVEVLGGDLGLRHRIHGGIDDDDSQDRVLVVGAVQLEGGSAEGLAVDLNLLRSLRILIGRVGPAQLSGRRATRSCRLVKFWSPTGRLDTCCWSKTVATSARSVFSSGCWSAFTCHRFSGAAHVHGGVDARRGIGLHLRCPWSQMS